MKDILNKGKVKEQLNLKGETKVISLKEKRKKLFLNKELIDKIYNEEIKVNKFGDLVLLDKDID
ncbi:hypothetical protein MWH28_05070 [Natroniella sulfidigena]|uniref:hypothetical protein n=1 Tax=Natroniella sulfidigena TaxID=723921 RepID=UPI002009F798|nr:hypothetical protein [Natroniella sulfidigena]MCK8816741.1 hypothetical protein [Natroniella sulfidigena]